MSWEHLPVSLKREPYFQDRMIWETSFFDKIFDIWNLFFML